MDEGDGKDCGDDMDGGDGMDGGDSMDGGGGIDGDRVRRERHWRISNDNISRAQSQTRSTMSRSCRVQSRDKIDPLHTVNTRDRMVSTFQVLEV